MNMKENIRLAWRGLRANKMRALLTMLGIIIGIASVIAILTAGDGMTNSVSSQMSELGTSNITVRITSSETQNMASIPDEYKISETDINNIYRKYEDEIAGVALSASLGSGDVQVGRDGYSVSVSGINQDYITAQSVALTDGREFKDSDLDGARNVALIAESLAEELYKNPDEAIGEKVDVYIDNEIIAVSVIGVYENTAVTGDSTEVYIPLTTANKLAGSDGLYNSITVMASSDVDSTAFASEIESYLNTSYQGSDYEISATSMESMLGTLDSMLSTISLALSIIAGISLLVGGIGVMNIMLVSVTERTREIGTRKALGATSNNIRIQFVTEGLIICSIGGIIGMILGGGLGYLGSMLIGAPTLPSISSITLSVMVSLLIGLFFGYYPANKAAKLNPIEALRYE